MKLTEEEVKSINRVFNNFHKTRWNKNLSVDPKDIVNLLNIGFMVKDGKRLYLV